ncbi:hypothetical protein NKI51_11655 [Mesorhizobium australicum]|uniref:hypothetical protein n=1 Tax=Mesorhizobium australicum TaxID=536018 RepID=UPI0033395CC3
MADALRSSKDGLILGDNGEIMVPTSPEVARLRLAELEADPAYVDVLLNPRHPLHSARLEERKGLAIVASGAATL